VKRGRTKDWVGPIPYGIGKVKPNHYGEMLRAVWQNRRHPLYGWRILRDGVCDGCALGTTGLRDFTMKGVHLCTVRLNLLPLNTMDAMPRGTLSSVASVAEMTSSDLRALGRLAHPMLWRAGEPGYREIGWDEALDLAGGAIRATDPARLAMYLTSRGITNEVYYAAAKAARFLGTNNIDNAARLCHAPSTVAMKRALGVSASSVSYTDWIGADLIVFLGSDVANNQPVSMKYLYMAKRAGTKVALVNPYREPGMQRYWVPSVAESALFGTKISDEHFDVHTGGDLAFLNGTLKAILEMGAHDERFIAEHTTGFDAVRATVTAASWGDLEREAGSTRAEMERFAALLRANRNTIFVWSMGLTQHRHGTDTVSALLNLALALGSIGREHAGVMPIRGHSGVQGGAEVGCVPDVFPGARPVSPTTAAEMRALWGFDVPDAPGMTSANMVAAAARGEIDVLWCAGGNFLETLPEPDVVRDALARTPHRIHQDIVATSQMLVPPATWSLILPARTRYETAGGGCETTTERRIIFSPEIDGPRPGEARAEWEIFRDVAMRAYPERADALGLRDAASIREEIDRVVPLYAGIGALREKGDQVQWGGRILCRDGVFATDDGRARFTAVAPPERTLQDGEFLMSTRRGKQFNSMVHRARDPLNGALREDVLISQEDLATLGLRDGARITVRSPIGTFIGRAKGAQIKPRNVQMHWPESQTLLARGALDPSCGVPDYNAVVTIEPA
jgi:molybdopterin-dependent oxidoreductase alpha subunit